MTIINNGPPAREPNGRCSRRDTALPNTDHYDRAEARGRKAYQAARKRGDSELEAVLAQIRATFDEQLRADTLAALKLSAAIASGKTPTMAEVVDVLSAARRGPVGHGAARLGAERPGTVRPGAARRG
jgi:hypothetical protein